MSLGVSTTFIEAAYSETTLRPASKLASRNILNLGMEMSAWN
jgi:hypothetical protein